MIPETGPANAAVSPHSEIPKDLPCRGNDWFAAVLKTSRDGILVVANGQIVEVNEACLRLLGYASANELVGRPLSVVGTSPAELQLLELGSQRTAGGEAQELLAFVAKRKDGTLIRLEVMTTVVALDGNSHRFSILRDSNARAELDAQRQGSLARLTDGVAHDLNNLLTAIRCQTELVLVYETVPPSVREVLRKVITAADRATNLTRQLRGFSRRQPVQLTAVDLTILLGNLAKMVRRMIGEGVELHLDAAPNLPLILADPSMLEQIILAMAVNAREAMPRGGGLKLSSALFQAEGDYLHRQPAARQGEFVALAVRDTGCGIAPELLPRVFDPSFTTKGAGKGNGLGLARAMDIIQEHQGWLEVESQVGQGTCFRIYLPARRDLALAAAPIAPKAEAVISGNETLLIVSNDRDLRQLTRLTLQKLGYHILEAASAVEGLDVWGNRASDIRLVLTETELPEGRSGYELIRQLRAGKPTLKAIVMGDCAVNLPEADVQLPAGVCFLSKPFDAVSLPHTIRRCLDEGNAPAVVG